MGISSFAGDLINSVICLEEASNSTCVTSVAGLCLRIRVAHNQALSLYIYISGVRAIEYNTGNSYFPSKQFEPEDNWERFLLINNTYVPRIRSQRSTSSFVSLLLEDNTTPPLFHLERQRNIFNLFKIEERKKKSIRSILDEIFETTISSYRS